jgi:hypothetical protein
MIQVAPCQAKRQATVVRFIGPRTDIGRSEGTNRYRRLPCGTSVGSSARWLSVFWPFGFLRSPIRAASAILLPMADPFSSRSELHRLVDELPEEQLSAAVVTLRQLQQDAVRSTLASIPGLRMPAHWPPQFSDFEPLPFEGEPPSEQLIRERR